jgi:hypothetical protein
MATRTLLVAAGVLAMGAWLTPAARAQACNNTSPNQPTALDVTRSSTNSGNIIVSWTLPASLCAATKVYVEASRDADNVIEANTAASSSGITMAVPKVNGIWRIAIRTFNEFGLSAQRSVALDESVAPAPNVPAPNPCPPGAVFPPTLVSANAVGRTLQVQWQPNSLCQTSVTGFAVLGQAEPGGPVIGTVEIPYPNVRAWSGVVPPGSYYVSVVTRFYQQSSPASNAIFVLLVP